MERKKSDLWGEGEVDVALLWSQMNQCVCVCVCVWAKSQKQKRESFSSLEARVEEGLKEDESLAKGLLDREKKGGVMPVLQKLLAEFEWLTVSDWQNPGSFLRFPQNFSSAVFQLSFALCRPSSL